MAINTNSKDTAISFNAKGLLLGANSEWIDNISMFPYAVKRSVADVANSVIIARRRAQFFSISIPIPDSRKKRGLIIRGSLIYRAGEPEDISAMSATTNAGKVQIKSMQPMALIIRVSVFSINSSLLTYLTTRKWRGQSNKEKQI
ncbi:MAG: hypothetical protein KKD07_10770 [Candidatus Omnitrophica bacterium]|nr:hypothetical protein [Candidatus Omnitrophota bacterium]